MRAPFPPLQARIRGTINAARITR